MNKLFLIAAMVLTLAPNAFAKKAGIDRKPASDCPIAEGVDARVDAIKAAIAKAQSCEEGAQIAVDCGYGSSQDRGIAEAAIAVCAKDYATISNKDSVLLKTLNSKCIRKYDGEKGTINISFEAFCELNVARLMSEFYTPVQN